MGFTLKIYFLGLIAFAVRPDGTQVTALMVDARQDYYLSDGCPIGNHVPLLVTKAASCEGPHCRANSESAFDALFGEDSEHTRLGGAMCGGSVWVLDNSDLSIATNRKEPSTPLRIVRLPEERRRGGRAVMPSEPAERRGFDWVADLGQIQSDSAYVDPKAVDKGLVAARFKLDTGTLSSCKLVSADNVTVSPLAFSTLADLHNSAKRREDDALETHGPTGAFADWLVAEIEIPDCSLTIEDRDFDGNVRRSVRLTPSVCDGSEVVEAALINLPKASFADPDKLPYDPPSDRCGEAHASARGENGDHNIGRHFEIFYELTECRPPVRMRPVPYLAKTADTSRSRDLPQVKAVPPGEVGSKLLQALLPADLSRGGYSRPICPVVTMLDRPQ